MGDLLRFEDVQRAAQGMNYMYFAFAVQAGLLEATTNAAIAAHEAGMPLSTSCKNCSELFRIECVESSEAMCCF